VDIIRQSFDALVGLEHEWVPRKPGTALYLRPTIIATDVMLGVHPAHNYIYFLILSPTTIALYLPQGLLPGNYTVRARNAQGSSSPVNVAVVANANFQLGTPIQVDINQSFEVLASRGSLSANALCVFCISTSNLPSNAPGVVDLGIGNQWSDLLTSSFGGFDAATRCATLVVPPMPFPLAYFQAAAFDVNNINPFPLPVTNVRQVQRP
jgi:hypothetical protein